jgi:hypothetical protein
MKVNCFDQPIEAIPAVLAIDAVVFRPGITIHEPGKVDGIQGIDHIQFTDLFSLFLLKQLAFQDSLKENFD